MGANESEKNSLTSRRSGTASPPAGHRTDHPQRWGRHSRPPPASDHITTPLNAQSRRARSGPMTLCPMMIASTPSDTTSSSVGDSRDHDQDVPEL